MAEIAFHTTRETVPASIRDKFVTTDGRLKLRARDGLANLHSGLKGGGMYSVGYLTGADKPNTALVIVINTNVMPSPKNFWFLLKCIDDFGVDASQCKDFNEVLAQFVEQREFLEKTIAATLRLGEDMEAWSFRNIVVCLG